jgi:hypothetical protein
VESALEGGGAVRNLSEKFRGSLPQNGRKREDSHPDFTAKLNIWNTPYSAAAWLSSTQKNDLYIALRLTSDGASQSEKIKLAIWRNHERSSASEPHFQSVQEVFGRDFVLKAWILPAGDNYRLEITIEPASAAALEVSDAVQDTRERIADFLAQTGVTALPPTQNTAKLPTGDKESDEPADIPF